MKPIHAYIAGGMLATGILITSQIQHKAPALPLPAGDQVPVVQEDPQGPPVRHPDVVFARTNPVVTRKVEGMGQFHNHKPGVYYVSLSRAWHESYYVGGQKHVTAGREIIQDLGQTEVTPDHADDIGYIENKIQRELPTPTPGPLKVSE